MRLSIEQMCREILTQALNDNLVSVQEGRLHPQERTAGDLAGTANLLQKLIRRYTAETRNLDRVGT